MTFRSNSALVGFSVVAFSFAGSGVERAGRKCMDTVPGGLWSMNSNRTDGMVANDSGSIAGNDFNACAITIDSGATAMSCDGSV